jgi:thiamine biosynthesis lipoprotein
MKELPNPELIKDHLKLVNYQNIILDRENQTVFLKEKGMRIGFGGIGKGMLQKWQNKCKTEV